MNNIDAAASLLQLANWYAKKPAMAEVLPKYKPLTITPEVPKYRALRLYKQDNWASDWAYGSLCCLPSYDESSYAYYIDETMIKPIPIGCPSTYIRQTAVVALSISKFTGVKSIDGHEVYVGDIVTVAGPDDSEYVVVERCDIPNVFELVNANNSYLLDSHKSVCVRRNIYEGCSDGRYWEKIIRGE